MCSTASRTCRLAPSLCPGCVALSTVFVPVLASSWHAAELVRHAPQPHALRASTPWASMDSISVGQCTPSALVLGWRCLDRSPSRPTGC
jgi:hypothetical protein